VTQPFGPTHTPGFTSARCNAFSNAAWDATS
jgi:hypothetical protein